MVGTDVKNVFRVIGTRWRSEWFSCCDLLGEYAMNAPPMAWPEGENL
jgi:hypothetical protein